MIGIDFPGPTLFDADATARLFIDDGAEADQQRELEPIMQGSKGGPMENIAPLVSTWLPTKTARIDVSEDGDSITITAEGAGALRSQLLRDPEGTAFTLRGAASSQGWAWRWPSWRPPRPSGPTWTCRSTSRRNPAPGGRSVGAGEVRRRRARGEKHPICLPG